MKRCSANVVRAWRSYERTKRNKTAEELWLIALKCQAPRAAIR